MESSPSRSDLARYLSRIREYPMLGADEEADLARAWRDRRDPEAAERLIGSHLRLVAKVARGYSQRSGISYTAWRQVGVAPSVLTKAGISRSS